MEVKEIIKSKRLELGITMRELSEKVGVSEATISRWESGDIANMKRDKISALAEALRVSPSIIMGWDKLPDPLELDEAETELVTDYRGLNDEGKNQCSVQMKMLLKTYPRGEPDGKD